MTVRLSTTVSNIEKPVCNEENVKIILRFFEFMKKIGTSERYQNNNLKAITGYSKDKLITALRTAVENGEGTLDKEITSYDDVFDAFRLAMKYYKYKD